MKDINQKNIKKIIKGLSKEQLEEIIMGTFEKLDTEITVGRYTTNSNMKDEENPNE